MSANAPAFYAQQFATNIELELQQKGSRLRPFVSTGTYKGATAQVVNRVGAVEMLEVHQRFAPLGRVDAPFDSRWVAPTDFELPQLEDSFDKLKMVTDPGSVAVQNAVAAAGRRQDRLIIAAAFAPAMRGPKGTEFVELPASQIVGVNEGGANTGLNVAKLKAGKRKLMKADVDLSVEPIYMALGADQHDQLANDTEVKSSDYNTKPTMSADGLISAYLGINFIHTELSQANVVAGDVVLPMWVRDGMHLGVWEDIQTDVSQRKDLVSLPWQVYVKMSMGATRLDEKKVIGITCEPAVSL